MIASSVLSLAPQGETTLPEFTLHESPPRPREERSSLQLESRGITSQNQGGFWEESQAFSESIVAKLLDAGRPDLANPLAHCRSEETIKRCSGCSKLSVFRNRCELKHCPMCQPRLAAERRESIEWWTKEVTQPKHVVLTARNTAILTPETLRNFKNAFAKLRRRRIGRGWRGGFYSLEVTNEGKGWHLHMHALIDARYIDAKELAVEWADCIGQDFAIVKVKDVREKSYLQEVSKYLVKGSELAKWEGTDIAAFIDSFSRIRTFGVFGTLFGKRTEWRAWLDSLQMKPHACECGCTDFKLMTPYEFEVSQLQPLTATEHKPPRPNRQGIFHCLTKLWPD